jgi:hypothetical protein
MTSPPQKKLLRISEGFQLRGYRGAIVLGCELLIYIAIAAQSIPDKLVHLRGGQTGKLVSAASKLDL